MSNIINSTNSYPVANASIKKENIQQNFDKSKQIVTENVENNSFAKMFMGDSKPNETIAVLVPLVFLNNLVDKLMTLSNGKGLLDKAAKLGDKISDALKLEKIFPETKKQEISKFINKNRFTKYFTSNYEAIPKSMVAKNSAFSEKFKSNLISGLNDLSKNPEFEQILKNNSNGLSDATKKVLASVIDPSKASKLTSEELIKTTEEITKKGFNKINTTGLFKKTINLQNLSQKLKASESLIGKTPLGKSSAKGLLKTKDILTYGGGDILSMIFVATGLINSYKEAKKAPKGEKLSTFMHVLSEQYLGLILLTPSTNLLYKVAGNKYRGMSVEGREALKTLINTSNNSNLSKEAVKIANIQKNLLIKGVDKDKVAQLAGKSLKEVKGLAKTLKKEGAKLKFWERPLKFAGKILATGLDTIKKNKYITLPKLGTKKLPHPTLKGFAGGFGRFMLVLMVISPLLQKPCTKLFHKIFGEPKTYLAKQEKENNTNNSKDTTKEPVNSNQENINQNTSNNKDTNLINILSNKPSASLETKPEEASNNTNNQEGYIPDINVNNQDEKKDENIPALNLFNKKGKEEQGSYIPSIEPVKVEDNSKELDKLADQILSETDGIIKESKNFFNN